ncbi:uncharacterized protein LOC129797691 [Lutzomyia longipalpis]|uniref:uncharacterized protein LOC129797691 n=1 Tax=Lutzomyia longipalpis TaxID=7200 RepID=UPI00248429E9|nr:uncharacterized protein LOC129797691 [Lutzomyia longipalpis]
MSKMEYVRDRSSPKQMEAIVKFMEDNPEFARQRGRGTNYPPFCKTMWLRLTAELNNLGPPVRDWLSWRRVWCDFKSSIQKKLKQRERFQERGVEPPKNLALSSNQERINNLLSDGFYQPRRRTTESSTVNTRQSLPRSSRLKVDYVVDEYEDTEGVLPDPLSEDGIPSDFENYSESESAIEDPQHQGEPSSREFNEIEAERLNFLNKLHSFEEKLLEIEEKRLQIEAERLTIEKRRLKIEESRFAREEARLTMEEARNAERIVPRMIGPRRTSS